LPDKPNLYMKDYAAYRAYYCGLCHQIGRCQGQCMRLLVNYDVTFLSILLHGLRKEEPEIRQKACVLNPFKKKPVVWDTPTMRQMVQLNALLVDFKCRDDIADGGKKGKKTLRRLLGRQVKKATEALPDVAAILDKAFAEQCAVEKSKAASWHMAADPFGEAMRSIIRVLADQYYTGELGMIGYLLGQYVYLMDALDDYDDDLGKKHYNPLALQYGAKDKATLLQQHGEALDAEVRQLIALVKENYRQIPIFGTEGIVTNTLWMGLWARYLQVKKENAKCLKTHTRF